MLKVQLAPISLVKVFDYIYFKDLGYTRACFERDQEIVALDT